MSPRVISTTLSAVFLFGCVSHEGTYSPDCIAYAGSNISLSDGQFVWEKFTDEVVVDDDGKIINQFPGFPMRGSYRVDGKTVHQDEGGLSVRRHDLKAGFRKPGDQAAKLAEVASPVAKEGPDQLRQGEYLLAIRPV